MNDNLELLQIDFTLHNFQLEFLKTEQPYVLLAGGSGIGKTYAAVLKIVKYAVEHPNAKCMIASPIWQNVVDFIQPPLFELLDKFPKGFYNHIKTKNRVELKNGSSIVFKNLHKAGHLKGSNLDIIWVDEATEVTNPADVFDQLNNRLRSSNPYYKQIIFTTNPELKTHYLYHRFYLQYDAKTDWVLTLPAAAGKHNPKEYFDRLAKMTGSKRQQLLLGEWGALEGQALDIKKNIDECDESDMTYYLAYDYGFRPDPAVWLLIGHSKEHVYIVDELDFVGKTAREQQDAIVAMIGDRDLSGYTGDTSSGSGEFRLLVKAVFDVPYKITSKKRYIGWKALIELADERNQVDDFKLKIHPRCKKTIESLESLCWKEKERDIESTYDHHADALRYWIMAYYRKSNIRERISQFKEAF